MVYNNHLKKLLSTYNYYCKFIQKPAFSYKNVNIIRLNHSSTSTQIRQEPIVHKISIANYPIHYVKVGNGPNVIFCLPGILGNLKIHMLSLIQNLDREKFTFVTWDQPGYARSTPPERTFHDFSLEEDTEIMIEFMKKIGLPKYSVMGWSGGGCSALIAAIKHPEIIQKVIVWGTFAKVDENDVEIFKYFKKRENRRGKMMEMLVDEYGDDFFHKHFSGWMDVFCNIKTNRGGEFISKDLNKIKCPSLILHGTSDALVLPKHGVYLKENIPNSRLVKWEGGKHNLHLRYSNEFNNFVQNFLLEDNKG